MIRPELAVTCMICDAGVGKPCRTRTGAATKPHAQRRADYALSVRYDVHVDRSTQTRPSRTIGLARDEQ